MVDGLVENKAVVHSWQRQGGRSMSLNWVIKKVFFTTTKLNMAIHLMYIPSKENKVEAHSCCLTTLECKLHPKLFERVQQEFSGHKGHTCYFMALDLNAMTDLDGSLFQHFTLKLSLQSWVSTSLRNTYLVEPQFWSIPTSFHLSP